MAGKGPPPTPTAILKARGSWRAEARKDEPRPALAAPTCPEWMPDDGKAEWKRVVGELSGLGLLTRLDRAALAVYCQAWSDFVLASTQSDSFTVRDVAAKRMIAAAAQFGMSPAARARVQASKPESKSDKSKFFKVHG